MTADIHSALPSTYPVLVVRVTPAGSEWRLDSGYWHTATSHDGWRAGSIRYTTREAALLSAERQAKEMRDRGSLVEIQS